MGADYLTITYAAIVAAGGTMGYVKSGSVPSLAAGLVFGSILGVGAYQTTKDPQNFYLAMGTSAVLGGIMGARYYNSRKMMPAGIITTLSVLMVCRFAARGLGLIKQPAIRAD